MSLSTTPGSVLDRYRNARTAEEARATLEVLRYGLLVKIANWAFVPQYASRDSMIHALVAARFPTTPEIYRWDDER